MIALGFIIYALSFIPAIAAGMLVFMRIRLDSRIKSNYKYMVGT